jgi:hypothetical protein
MVTINYNGRISNNFIQHIVGHFIARKYGLKLIPNSPVQNETIKFSSTEDGKIGDNEIIVNDDNWLDIVFGNTKYDSPHFHLSGFFNDKIFFESFEDDIKKHMTILYDDTIDDDSVMVNYRIGELNGSRRVLPVEYYYDALDSIEFNKGYITSDSLQHEFCVKLIEKYNLTPVSLNPSDTIAYCKNFNKLILSEGGFSWTIGFLSKAKEIICSGRHSDGRDAIWHGDIYFKKWKKLYWDYHPETVYGLYRLTEYRPIKLSENDFVFNNPDGTIRIETK